MDIGPNKSNPPEPALNNLLPLFSPCHSWVLPTSPGSSQELPRPADAGPRGSARQDPNERSKLLVRIKQYNNYIAAQSFTNRLVPPLNLPLPCLPTSTQPNSVSCMVIIPQTCLIPSDSSPHHLYYQLQAAPCPCPHFHEGPQGILWAPTPSEKRPCDFYYNKCNAHYSWLRGGGGEL